MQATAEPRAALVLSGGGARGAYEAGVLAYLFGELPQRLGGPVHFDLLTGTSVGAIHACYLAACQNDPEAVARLTAIWTSLSLDRVFAVGATDVFRVPLQLLGRYVPRAPLPATRSLPERLRGLFDTSWLESIVLENIGWQQLRANVDEGRLCALAIAATEVATGRSVVFVDSHGECFPEWAHDRFIIARPTRIGAAHALASAAIPLLFPAIRIDRTYYCDGGLRLNTPLAPALRLGADRVLVVGLRYPRPSEEENRIARRREESYGNPVYQVGKAINALLLDRVEQDVAQLRLFNAILEKGVQTYGPDFLQHINEPIIARRDAPYRIVREFFLQPSKDLGEVAASCVAHQRRSRSLRDWLSRGVVRYARGGQLSEGDLLSYLFFDRCYAQHLIELGWQDAERAADELAAFLAPAAVGKDRQDGEASA